MARSANWRIGLVVAALAAGVLAIEGEVGAQTAPSSCQPVADTAPRESSAWFDPQPTAELQRAVSRLRANDPAATFTFSDCEVDSFSTSPKDSVPEYARVVLRDAGMSRSSQAQQFLPGPTREDKPAFDLDGSHAGNKIPLPREAQVVTETSPDGSDTARGDPDPGEPPPPPAAPRPWAA